MWRALAMAKYLPSYGVHPYVLCADRAPGRGSEDATLLDDVPDSVRVQRLSSLYQNDIADPIARVAGRLPKMAKHRLMKLRSKMINEFPDQQAHWASKAALHGTWLAKTEQVAAVVTSGPPHISHLAGLMIKRASGLPWIVDYRDLWTDDPVQIKQSSYQQEFFNRQEAAVQREADRIVAVSPGYLEHLGARFAGARDADTYCLIRNGHDLSPAQVEAAHAPPNNARLHIHFNGTPQMTHPFGSIVQVFLRLRDEGKPLPLFTCTTMPAAFKTAVEENNLSGDIRDVGRMSREDSVRFATGCDVLVAMVNNENPLYRGTIPGKAYEAVGLSRHLLGILPANTVVKDLVADERFGTFVDVDDPESIYRGVAEIIQRNDEGTLNPASSLEDHKARAARFHRKAQASQLAELLYEVTSP